MIEAPKPHLKGQITAFPSGIETTFGDGLEMSMVVRLGRVPRARCIVCGKRRVLFQIIVGNMIGSPAMCAKDAGLR